MKRIGYVSAFVSLSLALSCGMVWAQNSADQAAQGGATTAAPDQTAQGAAAPEGQLQEVVVTAERRATNLQNTAIAITAISGDQLQALHLSNLSSLQTNVPGLQINDQGGGFFQFVNIRGVGATLASPTVQPGVALFRDGVLQGDSADNSTPLYDIRDTEVLKGPQGTLIGATSIGGAIEINSQDPTFNGVNGYALAGIGIYSDHHLQAAVNLPLNDSFAVRVAMDYRNRHSFYNDIGSSNLGYYYKNYSPTNPSLDGPPIPMLREYTTTKPWDDPGHVDGTAVRISFLWEPTSSFQVLNKFSYYYNVTGGEPDEPNPATYTTLFSAGPGPVYAGCSTVPVGTNFPGASGNQLVCPGAGVRTHSNYYYPGEKPFVLDYYNTEQWNELEQMEDLQLQYTFGNGVVLRSISGAIRVTGQYNNSVSFGPQNAGYDHYWVGPNLGQYTEEIDIISPTTGPLFSKLNWQAGAFYEERDTSLDTDSQPLVSYPYQPGQLPSILSLFEISNVIRNQGLYGQINWQFSNTLQLQVGLRENWDEPYSNNLLHPAPTAHVPLPHPAGQGIYALLYPPGGTSPAAYLPLVSENNNLHYSASVPTGKVGLQWTPAAGQNFYLFWARGYKSGGSNAATDYPTYTNETDDDFEIGWKGTLLGGHLLTQVGAYYDNYRNMLYQIFDATGNNDTTTTAFNLLNLKPTKLYGIEAAEQSRFGGLGINLSIDYSHSSLGGLTTLPNYALPAGFGSPLALPQCLPGHAYPTGTECFNYLPYDVSISGEQMPYAPTITADASIDYQIRIGTGFLDPRVTYHHTDKQYSSLYENAYSEMGPRNLLGATLDWVYGLWDVQLYGTNLTNQIYLVGSGGATVNYGEPRQMGFQFTRHF